MNKIISSFILIGITVLGIGFSLYQLGAGSRLASALQAQHQTEVVLYSASWCSACTATRHYLTAKKQPFVELDMEENPKAAQEFAQFGGHGIPLVLAKGEVIRGHQPSQLRRVLQLN